MDSLSTDAGSMTEQPKIQPNNTISCTEISSSHLASKTTETSEINHSSHSPPTDTSPTHEQQVPSNQSPKPSSTESGVGTSPRKIPSRRSSRSFSPAPVDASETHPLHGPDVNVDSDEDDYSPPDNIFESRVFKKKQARAIKIRSASGSEIEYDDEYSENTSAANSIYSTSPAPTSPFRNEEMSTSSLSLSKTDAPDLAMKRAASLSGMKVSLTTPSVESDSRSRSASHPRSVIVNAIKITPVGSPDRSNKMPSESPITKKSTLSGTSASENGIEAIEVAAMLSMDDEDAIPLASGKKNTEFHEVFPKIPKEEQLIDDCTCAFQKDMLYQGKMYISEKNVCFYSKVLAWVQSITIPFNDITAIEKKNIVGLIPNSIEITTPTQKYFLASFVQRDQTYNLLQKVLRSNKGIRLSTIRRSSRSSMTRPENCECTLDAVGGLLPNTKECQNCINAAASEQTANMSPNLQEKIPGSEKEDEEKVIVISDENIEQYPQYDYENDSSNEADPRIDTPKPELKPINAVKTSEETQTRVRGRSMEKVNGLSPSSPSFTKEWASLSRDNSPSRIQIGLKAGTGIRRTSFFDVGINLDPSRIKTASRALGLNELANATPESFQASPSAVGYVSPLNSSEIADIDDSDDESKHRHDLEKDSSIHIALSNNSSNALTDSTLSAINVSEADLLSPNNLALKIQKRKAVNVNPTDPESETVPAQCPCAQEHSEMIKVLDSATTIPASLEACWQMLYGDRPVGVEGETHEEPFLIQFLNKRKCKDAKGSNWYEESEEVPDSDILSSVKCDQPQSVQNGQQNANSSLYPNSHIKYPLRAVKKGINRRLQYQMPLSNPLGPASTKCNVREKIVHYEPGKYVCIKSTSQTPDVPAGNAFLTQVKLCFSATEKYGKTALRVSCQVEWISQSWLKLAINSAAPDGLRAYHKDLVNFLSIYINGHPDLERLVWTLNRPLVDFEIEAAEENISKLSEQVVPTPPPEVTPSITLEPTRLNVPKAQEETITAPSRVDQLSKEILDIQVKQQERLISHQRQQMLVSLAFIIAIWALAVAIVLHAAAFVYLGISRQQFERQQQKEIGKAMVRFFKGIEAVGREEIGGNGIEDLLRKLFEKVTKKLEEYV